MGTNLIQIGTALGGAALPIAYGPVRARGNNVLNQQLANNNRIAIYILGEGVWDGIDRLWINSQLINLATSTQVHFHNGFDGTLGAGLAPTSFGGDQLVDQFWSLLPANFQPLTYSRKAYIMVQLVPDEKAPSSTIDVVGDYRTARVRIFDASGNQTAFQYSLNPVWQLLDLVIRQMLNREWNTAAAAAGGGDLTAAMKSRISFASFQQAAAICDTVLANGAKTFEGGVAYPQITGMQQAMAQLCTLSQTYLVEQSGQITLLPDQARPSTFILTSDHITAGSFDATKSQLRAASNRFIGTFNDVNAQKNADIDTVGNTGLSRTANVTTVKVPAGQVHGFLVNDNVDIVNPTDASFAGTIVVTTVISSTQFSGAQTGANATSGGGYVGTTESRFAQRTTVVDHEQHQLAVGQRGLGLTPLYKRVPITVDFGNNTMERVQRLLNFIKVRNLGADAVPYTAPFGVQVQASAYSVDVNGNALIAQLPGDILTIDGTISEEFQGDYEIMNLKYSRPAGDGSNQQNSGADQSGNAETIGLVLKQYLPSAFSTLSDAAQALVASLARSGLKPVESLDGSGGLVVNLGRTVDDAVTARFAVLSVDPNRRALTDFSQAGHLNKHMGNIADDAGSGRYARRASRLVTPGVAQWFKVGTWIFAGDGAGHTLHLDILGGLGYNTAAAQQGHAEIVVRSSNNASGAPNISGATWTAMGTSPITAVKIVATGGSVLQTNASWEVWADFNPFADSLVQASVDTSDTWTPNGTSGADPGVASTTVAVATGQAIVDASGIANPGAVDFSRGYTGKHLGNIPDDAGSARFAVALIDAARKALIDFAQGGHTNKHLGNIPDDGTSARFAVASIDAARKALIDFAQTHTNKHLGNIPDDTATTARRAHLVGTLANRPAAGTAGRLYHATDVGTNGTTYRDTGAAWAKVGVGHLGDADGNLDNVTNGTRCAWDTGTQKTAAVDSSGNLLLKNKTQASGSTFGPTTSSTSFSTMPEMSVTITTKGNNVLLLFSGSFIAHLGTGTFCVAILQVFRDGVALSVQFLQDIRIDGQTFTVSMSHLDASASAGSHTYDVRWEVNNNSNSQFLSAQGTNRAFQVVELG